MEHYRATLEQSGTTIKILSFKNGNLIEGHYFIATYWSYMSGKHLEKVFFFRQKRRKRCQVYVGEIPTLKNIIRSWKIATNKIEN